MRVNILGAGTWGTALAFALSKNDIDVNRLQQIINAKLTQLMIENKIDGNMRFTVTKEKLSDVNKSSKIIKRISLGNKITLKV